MAKTVTISDGLAERLVRKLVQGQSLDAAAEALITYALDDADDNDLGGLSVEEVRALLAESERSPAADWDSEAVWTEVRRRAADRNRQS